MTTPGWDMGIRQFANSLSRIVDNPQVSSTHGIARHLMWQIRKACGLFPFEQTISQSKIRACHRHCGVSALIFSQGLYDFNNMSLLKLLLRGGESFFDVGANIGCFTLIASECPDVRVFAFEPGPAAFAELEANLSLNKRTRVSAFNCALGARGERLFLSQNVSTAINEIHHERAAGDVEVLVRTAADVIDELACGTPKLVKIDTEGHERAVLEGFGARLKEVDYLFIEVSNERDAVLSMLAAAGLEGPYNVDFDARRITVEEVAPGWEDTLFVSPRAKAELEHLGFVIA